MPDVLITLGSFAGLGLLIYGLVTLVRPFGFIHKRWQAGLAALAGLTLIGALQSIPAERPEGVSAAEWARRVDVCSHAGKTRDCPKSDIEVKEATEKLARERVRAEVADRRNQRRQTTVLQNIEDGPPSEEAIKGFKAANSAMLRIVAPCDKAMLAAAEDGMSSPVRSYQLADRAYRRCADASLDLRKIRFGAPIAVTAARDLNEAMECIGFAYTARRAAFEKARAIFNGKARPSMVDDFQRMAASAAEMHGRCVASYAVAAKQHGFPVAETDG